jgi:hypothetical protein
LQEVPGFEAKAADFNCQALLLPRQKLPLGRTGNYFHSRNLPCKTPAKVHVCISKGIYDFRKRQAKGLDPVRFKLYANFPVKPAPQIHLDNPENSGKPVADLVFDQLL